MHWRSLPCKPWGGGQQRHWRSRSLTFQFLRFGGGEGGGGLQGSRAGQGSTASSPSRLLDDADARFQWVFRTFPGPKKSAEVARQWSPRVLGSVSSSTLSAHQMAPDGKSDELEDEPGDALDAAVADLQRWRRGLGGRRGVEAEAAVQSSSPSTT